MSKDKKAKVSTKRLVASGIMLFGGFLTFINKPQDVHAEDGAAPIRETNSKAKESSNVAVLKSSVKPTSDSASAAGKTNTSYTEEISKTITVKGKQHILTSRATDTYYPMFFNSIKAPGENLEYAYSYYLGDSSTSAYYMRDENGKYTQLTGRDEHAGSNITQVTIERTADSLSKTFKTHDGSVQVKESVTIGAAGVFEHTVTVKNLTDTDMNDVSFGMMLDTRLDGGGDKVSINASGDGGAFIWTDGLTVYANGVNDVNVYVGKWSGPSNDITEREPVPGVYQEDIVKGGDSALQYETGKVNLSAGSSYSFKFNERVRPGSHDTGKLTVRYVDTEGNVIHPEQVLQDTVGESWTVTPMTINGFTFQEASKELSGTYTKAPKFLTLVYKKNAQSTLPGTEGPKATVKPATPTKKTPTPAPMATPKSNNVLPQTGEKPDITASAIGIGILATLSLFGFAKLRKREND